MTSRGWLFAAWGSGFLASACLGGQSGTEADPAGGCGFPGSRPADSAEVDALAAEVESATSVPMKVHTHDAGISDTTLTLTISVNRASGRLSERGVDLLGNRTSCGVFLTAGAILHFDAADGSFMDVFEGTIEKGEGQILFTAPLRVDEHRGTLDLTALGKGSGNQFVDINTTLGSMPSGHLFFDGAFGDIAQWP